MKTFEYKVNGCEYVDTVPFGDAWRTARELAKMFHCGITRIVRTDEEERHEFFAKGGCFLDESRYTEEKMYIF